MARNCWIASKVACSTRAIAFVDACGLLGARLLAPFQMGEFVGSRTRRGTGQRCACLQVCGPSRFVPREEGRDGKDPVSPSSLLQQSDGSRSTVSAVENPRNDAILAVRGHRSLCGPYRCPAQTPDTAVDPIATGFWGHKLRPFHADLPRLQRHHARRSSRA